jgi:hypothetical protein
VLIEIANLSYIGAALEGMPSGIKVFGDGEAEGTERPIEP